jgi:nitroreductase
MQDCLFLFLLNKYNYQLPSYLEKYKKTRNPSKKKFNSVEKMIKRLLEDVLSAPVYVAVLVDSNSKYPEEHIYCGTLAAENLFIAARSLGYGTGFYTTFFPGDKIKKFFKIPDQYKLICFTPIGVPEKWPEMPPKKALDEIVVFETF